MVMSWLCGSEAFCSNYVLTAGSTYSTTVFVLFRFAKFWEHWLYSYVMSNVYRVLVQVPE